MVSFTGKSQSIGLHSVGISATKDTYCFQFAYYILLDEGKYTGLSIEVLWVDNTSKSIWYSGGMNYDQWEFASVDVQPQGMSFKV